MVAKPLERTTGRVIPLNSKGQALLMHGFEPAHPETWYWFTIGGAVEGDETTRQAAARELREETGIAVDPRQLHGPVVEDTVRFSFAGLPITQHQAIYTVRLPDDVAVDLSGLGQAERATIDRCAWIDADALARGDATPVNDRIAGYIGACQRYHAPVTAVEHDVAVAALVRNGRALLCRRSASKPWYPSCWDFAGGHVEDGETPEQAMLRESAEELAVFPTSYTAVDFPFQPAAEEGVRLTLFRVTAWDGQPTNVARDEHDEIRWFAPDELGGLVFPHPSYPELIRYLVRED